MILGKSSHVLAFVGVEKKKFQEFQSCFGLVHDCVFPR